jgi:RHS repeat-associated protein
LLSVKDALGYSTNFTYDRAGNQTSRTSRIGYATTYAHDGFGNLAVETDGMGNPTYYTYDTNGNRLSETRSRTKTDGTTETLVTRFSYDKNGRLLSTTQPDGSTTSTTYNAAGLRATTTDALGRVTSYAYDDQGWLTTTTYPDGTTTSSTYDEEGRRLTSTDRGGRVTTMAYDGVGRLLSTTYADGAVTSTAYALNGRVTSSTDAGGHITGYQYDKDGRQTVVTDALGKATSFSYDDAGNQLTVTDALGHVTTSIYDADNRLVTTKFADSTQRSTTYDHEGQRIAETDQAGKATNFAYDDDGRLVSVTDALGQVTSYAYDEVGNRVSVTDAAGKTTSFEYDKLGRETKRALADGKFETKGYDAGGEMVSRTDFQGRTTTYGYDLSGRLTGKTYADSSTVGFGYSATGRRTTATDGRGTTTYTYDSRDRVTAMEVPGGRRIEYGYNTAGNRTSLTAQVGSATLATGYRYDVLDRIATVTDPNGRVFSEAYDDVGNLSKLVRPNGVDTTYAHDSLNRLTNVRTAVRSTDTTIASYGYTLGATGIRTRIDEADGTVRAYTYDDLYRLTQETVSGGDGPAYQKTFTYDQVSNRTSQTTPAADGGSPVGGAGTINYTYDNRDRLLTEGSTVYSWSANGNLVGRTGDGTFEWDFEDRLVKVTKADGTVVENVYDVDGVLVRTAVNGVGTDYLVDTSGGLSHVVAEVDSSGAVAVVYVRAGDMLLEEVRGGLAKMYEADGLGSVRGLLDANGATTDTWSYTAFGETLSQSGTDGNPYQFAGERYVGDVGMYQNRDRWLDTRTGTFVSVDPERGGLGYPMSMVPYLYGNASPVTMADPTGRQTLMEVGIVLMAVSTLACTSTPDSKNWGQRNLNVAEGQRLRTQVLPLERETLRVTLDKLVAWDPQERGLVRTWFGEDSEIVRAHVTAVLDAARAQSERYTEANFMWRYFPESEQCDGWACVNPGKDSSIYLTPRFFSEGAADVKSQAVALVHERTHFNSVGATSDITGTGSQLRFWQTRTLARFSPLEALANAQSYALFLACSTRRGTVNDWMCDPY